MYFLLPLLTLSAGVQTPWYYNGTRLCFLDFEPYNASGLPVGECKYIPLLRNQTTKYYHQVCALFCRYELPLQPIAAYGIWQVTRRMRYDPSQDVLYARQGVVVRKTGDSPPWYQFWCNDNTTLCKMELHYQEDTWHAYHKMWRAVNVNDNDVIATVDEHRIADTDMTIGNATITFIREEIDDVTFTSNMFPLHAVEESYGTWTLSTLATAEDARHTTTCIQGSYATTQHCVYTQFFDTYNLSHTYTLYY